MMQNNLSQEFEVLKGIYSEYKDLCLKIRAKIDEEDFNEVQNLVRLKKSVLERVLNKENQLKRLDWQHADEQKKIKTEIAEIESRYIDVLKKKRTENRAEVKKNGKESRLKKAYSLRLDRSGSIVNIEE